MEEVKYHQRFHQANMSHLLSIFNKSKNIMLVMVASRIIFEQNIFAALGIFMGYMIMVACTNRLEKSNISNNKSVLLLAHFITFIKVVTWVSATIRKNETPPTGLQTGVIIWFILTLEAMKAIEPDYIKAIKMFWLYWTSYLAALCIYYQEFMIEQFVLFGSLFWLVYEIYKEKYELSNSLTEIFYDFHNDPILIYENENDIKANSAFLNLFGSVIKSEKIQHHSQMLTSIINPDKILFEFFKGVNIQSISLLEVIRHPNDVNQKELILRKHGGDKIFAFTFYRLENIYNNKTICIFKDTTHIHQLQKVKSQVEFRSVIMGCLTHELRTPVNCVLSILGTLQEYIEDSDEAKKLLTICLGTIEMLRSLTEDFIDFTRFENEKGLPIKKELVNIKDFFEDIQNIFGFQAEEKDIRFDVNISYNVPHLLYTDPKRLKQVLLNLLSNSFKFTQRGKIEVNLLIKKGKLESVPRHFTDEFKKRKSHKTLTGNFNEQPYSKNSKFELVFNEKGNSLTHATEDDLSRRFLIIEVVDTGLGIDEKDRRELFTKFATGGNSRGLNTNGLGLGLYLSREICKKLGGDIGWESIVGIGSTFIIKLPFDSKEEIREILKSNKLQKFHAESFKSNMDFPNEYFDEFESFDDDRVWLSQIHSQYDFKTSSRFPNHDVKIIEASTFMNPQIKAIKQMSHNESTSLRNNENSSLSSLIKQSTSSQYDLQMFNKWNCKKVLIVDDLAFNLLAVECMLKKKFGVTPDKAFSGDESITKVKQKLMSPWCKSYSLILMDYYMPPGMNGSEASLKIKQILKHNHQKSYIAWLTSQREGDFAFNKGLKHFDHFFSKPIHPDDIKSVMDKISSAQ